ncbi:MAG TPA: polyprenyl synthetase family protein [Chloroflexota bacterium]|nr:polyprenyl synthetase family protein [Chloroflexota bacterium]
MTSTAPSLALIQQGLAAVESALIETAQSDHPLMGPMLSMVLPGTGKRMRPALALLTAQLGEASPRATIDMAVGVELLHAASLVHDDVVDESALRRGDETLFTRVGNSLAVLVGDYLFAQSASRCVATGNVRVIGLFAETLASMCQGQIEEAARLGKAHRVLTREAYFQTIWGKTASLFVLACEGSAVLADLTEAEVQAARRYGDRLGLAFQVVDDILDFVGDERVLGKQVGSDVRQGIVTLPVLCLRERISPQEYDSYFDRDNDDMAGLIELVCSSGAIDDAYAEARALMEQAQESLEMLPPGPGRDALYEIASYTIERPR